ncbi:hypothetical protein RIF29_14474 [Crotalaria pallida]|uniref:Uncharacterized protein n=1 Tax=Crotalaria pallida TaxID=3830 RepID=A0AAN9FDG5_CROPI
MADLMNATNTGINDKLKLQAHDVNFAMEASRKSHHAFAAVNSNREDESVPVTPHLGAIEIAEVVLGASLKESVNAFMVAPEDESLSVAPHLGAIEIGEVVLGALLEEAVIDIYL